MIDKLKQRELDMRRVLLHIQRKAPFEDLSFEERRILKECYDAGYFEGVIICEMASGRVVAEYRHEPRLTLKGLQFLGEITSTDNAENICDKPDERANDGKAKKFCQSGVFWGAVAAVAAVLSVVITALIHFGVI